MSYLKNVVGVLLLVALVACRKEPPYDPIPEISYLRYDQKSFNTDVGGRGDSITLYIYFKDGDGDLGLHPASSDTPDAQYPYSFLKPDGSPNKFYQNYFVNLLIKENGRFVPLNLPDASLNYSGRYLRLSQDDRLEPLEGTLKYILNPIRQTPQVPQLRPGSVIKFEIQIADRALNLSNIVETEEITLKFDQ